MKKSILLPVILFCFLQVSAQQKEIKIGLTLSGGGAKGLAHIGILQAIDSAGLNIDYITGTSMGSIMGAMYAVGYSGNEIEKMARAIDWNSLFSGKPLISNVNITEKNEFENYALEIPFEKGKLKIGTGLIEGQEIWVKFQEIFMPVYNVKDFNKFSIPFRCIATDVGTGQVVKLDSGEVVNAIRSSMAIPSVFTAIDYQNTKLVDGGMVRNFPVRDAIEMGATYTIGVKVAVPLLPAEELKSAFDVLYQIGFYKDAEDFPEELKLCNMLIDFPMKGYNAASFAEAGEIIDLGKEMGRKYYPAFKHLADSLKNADPNYTFRKNRLPDVKNIVVDEISVNGLQQTSKKSFFHLLGVKEGDTTDGIEIGHGIRRIFGTRNYNRINYAWRPTADGHAKLNFNVVENPRTYIKLALHYNTFGKMALVTGIQSKNLLLDRSKTTIKLNFSENYRILFEQNQTLGKRDNNHLIASFYLESFKYPIYKDFQQTYLYRNNYMQIDLRGQHTFKLHSALGVGTSYESQRLIPKVFGEISAESGNNYFNSYMYFDRNTLDKKQFPKKGMKVHVKSGYVYSQNPDELYIEAAGLTAEIDTLSFDGYAHFQLGFDHYSKLNSKFTLIKTVNSAFNFDERNSYLNYFYIGGLTDFLRNQITFAGLNEYEVYTNSAATALLGLQYNPYKSVYATLRVNAAIYDFLETDIENLSSDNFLSGYSASIGYDSGLGPIQFSLIYCDQSKNLAGYINVGYHF